jgi:D-serine deaminase-like pyridoxal phosphate-dependent protein
VTEAAGTGDLRRLNAATSGLEPSFAVIDLAAFLSNAADMTRRAGGTPIRLASKSVRCRHLITQTLDLPGFRGILAFTLPEALWLAESGVSDDIVVAYPTADETALSRLASQQRAAMAITVMVDSVEHLDLIAGAAATVTDPHPVRVGIDIDAGYEALGGAVRAGARRSPVRTPAQAAALARAIAGRPGFRLAGLMAYEAQIAGVGDNPPGRPAYARAIRLMQRRSAAELAQRRAAIVDAVRAVAPVGFVNGGGTGSIAATAAEPAVTEVGAGSGLYQPRLFDAYRAFSGLPAALFALPWCAAPAQAWRPCWAAATWRLVQATQAGCRSRTCRPASSSTATKARAKYRHPCSARPPMACGSATWSGSGTRRRASYASGSTSCT